LTRPFRFGFGKPNFVVPDRMDQYQYIRLKQEAANVYLGRNKTVDASLLTYQRELKAAYAGSSAVTSPVVLGTFTYDSTSEPSDNGLYPYYSQPTRGYANPPNVTQGQQVLRVAGGYACNSQDYTTGSAGITLLNCSTVTTILTGYNNLTPAPSLVCKVADPNAHFFPNKDKATDSCANNTLPYPSG